MLKRVNRNETAKNIGTLVLPLLVAILDFQNVKYVMIKIDRYKM